MRREERAIMVTAAVRGPAARDRARDALADLRAALAADRAAPGAGPLVDGVHFMRWFLLWEEDAEHPGGTCVLVHTANVDPDPHPGDPFDAHVRRLAASPYRERIARVLGECDEPFPGFDDAVAATRWFRRRRHPWPPYVHIGAPWLTAARIVDDARRVAALRRWLDDNAEAPGRNRAYVGRLLREDAWRERFGGVRLRRPKPAPWFGRLAAALPVLGMAVPHVFPDAPCSVDPPQASRARRDAVTDDEDRAVQNPMTVLHEVRDGVRLRLALTLVATASRWVFNQGSLGGITTIHWARWVIVVRPRTRGRYLLFLSNWDFSWSSYLDDFIRDAYQGVNAIWRNTEGFPPVGWALGGGCRDRTPFLRWVRAHQVRTQAWYTAYPTLDLRTVLQNDRLLRGLDDGMTAREEHAWRRAW